MAKKSKPAPGAVESRPEATFTPFAKEYGKATKAALDAFEVKIGMALPDEYRKFVLKHNGGSFDGAIIKVVQRDEEVTLDVLCGVGIIPQLDLTACHDRLAPDLPEQSFVIGHDPGGNPFLMDLSRADEPGAVYYWDIHHMLNKRTRKAVAYQLTKSFGAFLAGLPVKR